MARPRRRDQIDLQEAIKTTAWQQIAASGAAALSLRAIARALHITAPAIYNYYPRRDDLVTALIVDAYTSLGDSQWAAIADLAGEDHAGRLKATGLAYRQWAITYPQRYQLIFGTPIPGYHAPLEVTMPAASRALGALIYVLDEAFVAGQLLGQDERPLQPHLKKQLAIWRGVHTVSDEYVLYLALVLWSRVHGLVMLEIGSQFPPFIEDFGEIFRREIDMMDFYYLRI